MFVSRSLMEVEKRYAKIKKEALTITWTCERLVEYLIGLQFHIHTDYKPLIYLFSAEKLFDAVPPRIQRFRLCMLRFSFSISCIPGTMLYTADALFRFPLRNVNSNVPDMDIFVASVVKSLPICECLNPSLIIVETHPCRS